jgi:cell division septation protein DedD
MNLADYLSELLGQLDEVGIPGLGYFVRTRINAYYNDGEARFYPPYHQVKFIAKATDDETFAQYVADKKNISLASSKYFIEKFTTKLKEDAAKGKYLFADLGIFQKETDQLVFKPNDRIPADPAFYGYPPVPLSKINQPISYDQKKPVFTQTETTRGAISAAAAASVAARPVQAVPQPQYYEEETEQKKGLNVWLIILIALTVVALGLFAVYKFYPSAFDKVKDEFDKVTGKTTDVAAVIPQPVKKDTVKKIIPVKDTATKIIAAVPDTVKTSRFEAIADRLVHLEKANERVKYLKSQGYNAYIVLDAPGPFIKVSVGAYPTSDKADSAIKSLLNIGRINKQWRYEALEIPVQSK